MGIEGKEIDQQGRCIGEIEYPSPPGGHRDQSPSDPLGQTQPRLADIPFLLPMQAQPRIAIPLDPTLNKNEKIGPHGLRTGIAAPHAAQRRGEQKQTQARHDQQTGHEIKLMRPNLDPEKEKSPVRQIQQNRLIRQRCTPVPTNPGRDIVDAQGDNHDHPFQVAKLAINLLGKDRFARSIEGLRFGWMGIGHGHTPV